MKKTKGKVLVGISGGVDSAVTAHLLKKEGYEVVAGFMKNYANPENPDCHTRKDRNMAIKVAHHLGIKTFVIFDFRKEYHETIIKYIYNGYKKGYTPNPDVLCNTKIKFATFLDAAKNLGCDFIATGHYARINKDAKGYHLLKGIDKKKDQSYFLSGLNQEQLKHSLFPVGDLTKSKVREIADSINLPNADRKDSQGLCFIGNVSMKEFLAEALPKKTGKIVDTKGNELGEHDGAWFYTIGQRHGLGLGGGPWFVVDKDVDTNTLVVGHKKAEELFAKGLEAVDWHWINDKQPPSLPLEGQAKIRYRQADQKARVEKGENKSIHIYFEKEQRAISPGQVVAIYQGEELIGNGIIKNKLTND